MTMVKLEQLETINLLDLSDISFSSPIANGDVLVYNSFSGNWENNINIGDYLPLAGGTMSGDIDMDGNAIHISTGDKIQVDGSGAIEISSDKGVICKVGATTAWQVAGINSSYTNRDGNSMVFAPPLIGGIARLSADDDGTAFGGSIAWPMIMAANRQWNLPDESGTMVVGEGWNTIIANAGASEDGKVIAWDDGSSEYTLVTQAGGGSQTLADTLVLGNITNGTNITTSDGDVINAANGSSVLNLRDGGDGIFTLSNSSLAIIYGSSTRIQAAFGSNAGTMAISSSEASLNWNNGSSAITAISHGEVTAKPDTALSTISHPFIIGDNNATITHGPAVSVPHAVFINNSDDITFNAGIEHSVALAIKGPATVKDHFATYITQLALVNGISDAFQGVLGRATLTSDRSWNLPDEYGTIPVGEGWNTIIANAGVSEDGKVIAWDDGSSEYTLVTQAGGGSQTLQDVCDLGSIATGLSTSVKFSTSADVNISAVSGMITLDAMDINVGNTGSVTNTYVKANDLVEIESSIAVNIIAAGQLDIQSTTADVSVHAFGDISLTAGDRATLTTNTGLLHIVSANDNIKLETQGTGTTADITIQCDSLSGGATSASIRLPGTGDIGTPAAGYVLTAASSAGELRWTAPTGGGAFLPLAGGTMTGTIQMEAEKITFDNPANTYIQWDNSIGDYLRFANTGNDGFYFGDPALENGVEISDSLIVIQSNVGNPSIRFDNTSAVGTCTVRSETTTAARTITLPDETGTVALVGDDVVTVGNTVPVLTSISRWNFTTNGANTSTLNAGVQSQRILIVYAAEGAGTDSMVITPTTLHGYSTLTFNDIGDTVELKYDTTYGWSIISTFNTTIA
jgi:hypothetical protein